MPYKRSEKEIEKREFQRLILSLGFYGIFTSFSIYSNIMAFIELDSIMLCLGISALLYLVGCVFLSLPLSELNKKNQIKRWLNRIRIILILIFFLFVGLIIYFQFIMRSYSVIISIILTYIGGTTFSFFLKDLSLN
jgi:hypothetical protein